MIHLAKKQIGSMDRNENGPHIDEKATLSKGAEEAVRKGIDWLKRWYTGRVGMNRENGDPLITKEMSDKIVGKLDNLSIYAGDDAVESIRQDLASGKLHPTEYGKEHWQDPAYVKSQEEQTRNSDHMGATWQNIEESPVFLHEEHIKGNWSRGYTSKDGKLVGVIGPVDELMVHEGTHAADLDRQNDDRIGYITNHDILSFYSNQPREIYARLNNLRYRLQADPSKVFTVEEVARVRKQCEADMRYFEEKVKEPGVDVEKLVSEPGRLYDDKLFDRFTDEQICTMLNDVALQRSKGSLRDTHGEHLASSGFVPDRFIPHRTEQTVAVPERSLHVGVRFG